MQKDNISHIPYTILISAFIISFCMGTRNLCIPPMEYIIREELQINHTQIGVLFTVPIIMSATLSIPTGIFVDRLGVKKAGGIGIILMALGAVLRGTANDYTALLSYTFILGVGGAFVLPSLPKLVSLWTPREKFGIAMGTYFTGVSVGSGVSLAITLPLIFPITNTFQGTFLIWSIPYIIGAIVWWALVKDPPPTTTIHTEVTRTTSMLVQILKNRTLWYIAAFSFSTTFFFIGWNAWAPALIIDKGAPPEQAAFISSIIHWVTIPSLLLAPRLSNRIGLRKPFLWLTSAILALITFGAMYATVNVMLFLMVVLGLLNSARQITNQTLPIEIMPHEVVGTASGLIMSVGFSGGIVGPIITGYILDTTGNFNTSLLVLVIVSVIALGITLKIPETGPKVRTLQQHEGR